MDCYYLINDDSTLSFYIDSNQTAHFKYNYKAESNFIKWFTYLTFINL